MQTTGKITIVQGEKVTFTVKLRDSEANPFDLSGFDKYKVCLPGESATLELSEVDNGNGSIVTLSGNALLGTLTVTISPTDTKTLRVDERMDVDLEIDNVATPAPRRVRFVNVLTVIDSLCP